MESQKCKVTISGKEYLYEKGTSYQEIAKDFQKEYKHQIALVMLDGHRLQELRKQVSGDCTLQFITTQDTAGYDTYRRSVCFLFINLSNLFFSCFLHVFSYLLFYIIKL